MSQSVNNQSDVIIIGGGLMGASAAFFLRQRNRSVTLLETGLIGQQASGVNFGNVRRQGRPLFQLPLAGRASPIWRNMNALLGEDVEYIQSGHMRVCYRERAELADSFETYAREARQYGLDLEILSGNALRQKFPFLGPDVYAGSYSATDGHANPRLAAPAFGRAAARLGANICENTEVVRAEKDGVDFRVTAKGGRVFKAPVLLVTAGAWGNALSEQFGEPVPLTPRGPNMSVTEPVPYTLMPTVGVSTPLEIETVYFRQIPRGNIIIGGSTRAASYPDIRRAYVKPENTLTQLREIRRLVPALGRLNIIRTWSGIEGYMPDSLPAMGPSGTTSGLYYAFGFSGSGFQVGPAVGDVMAELIDEGATTTPIEMYDIRRLKPVAV
ncbi:NAD(P)/FAD-dependent oxidoreductase [Asticcacaulis endophyticus]|uniref:Sarcosine oxidase subunit beta n=1 Tax=Asticcacaulis endophyticus TaxID=1395890 RepID=A0A918Q2Z2_9CAUL|nr:FAD-binding oxidoreductase [Asticcacaulis endophyticus]GGZ31140.1 sarcosine oxidase subunit beta [Asticcacaulis endophyticus]